MVVREDVESSRVCEECFVTLGHNHGLVAAVSVNENGLVFVSGFDDCLKLDTIENFRVGSVKLAPFFCLVPCLLVLESQHDLHWIPDGRFWQHSKLDLAPHFLHLFAPLVDYEPHLSAKFRP